MEMCSDSTEYKCKNGAVNGQVTKVQKKIDDSDKFDLMQENTEKSSKGRSRLRRNDENVEEKTNHEKN